MLFISIWDYAKTRLLKESYAEVREYAIPTKEKFTDFETGLNSAIIKRMYDFCRENSVKLIVVDIPMLSGKTSMKSSFSAPILDTIKTNSDAYILTETLLAHYAGVAETHAGHGHRHISEFTHPLIGVAVARQIQRMAH